MSFQPSLPFEAQEADLAPAAGPLRPSAPERKPSTPRLLEELARVCRERPMEEKVFVAPSLAIGHQLLERLALEGTSWINLRVETVRNLAHAFVGPALAREGVRLLSRAQALALLEQACSETLDETSYFGALRDRPGLHRALQSTFEELRAAGIAGASLPASAFADPRKLRELKAILRAYESALEKGGFVDWTEVLRRAARAAGDGVPVGAPLYLLPEGMDLSHLERRFFERLSDGRLEALATDPPEDWTRQAAGLGILRALGEENEIRQVFRALLRDAIPFDQAELLHTDASTYPALIWELASEHGIPCTFAAGIAVSFTRPGQAALSYLGWLRGGYETDVLRRALASGTVSFRKWLPEENTGPADAARSLREAGIGWGRGRHRTCLDGLIRELESPEGSPRDEAERDSAERSARSARRARRLSRARLAGRFTGRVLEITPETEGARIELSALARAAREFVAEFARVRDDLDATAATALEKLFSEFEVLPSAAMPPSDAILRLSDAVATLHVAADRPRPGRLHVAEYRSGGYSGRPHTFLLGLDESRHPGTDLQDPVLLDEERRGINAATTPALLALSEQRPLKNTLALQACLARLRGRVSLSHSCFDVRNLSQPGEQFPAPALLEAFRRKTGESGADYSRLDEALPRAVGFFSDEASALDETEWWLARLEGMGGRQAAAPLVRALYPWLADGRRAEEERESDRFTAFDGWVQTERGRLDPRTNGVPMSCSRIETLASCPFRYFLKHVLRIEPPDGADRDAGQWLDPMAAGSLLHEVFRRFLQEITDAGEKPSFQRHWPRLAEIAEEEIATRRDRIPPRTELAFSNRREEVLFTCRTFLRLEEEHCREVTPRYFEVAFGMPGLAPGSALASPDPVEIPLAEGQSFRLRGCIDRVDELADGSFGVWDYKTGSSLGIHEAEGIRAGRQIQFALYALAFERLTGLAGRPITVSRSGYFFPGRKGQGQRSAIPLDPGETREVVSGLFDLLRDGAFPHTPEKEDCRFCDYQSVCAGPERAVARACAKLESSDDPVLRNFLLRRRPE